MAQAEHPRPVDAIMVRQIGHRAADIGDVVHPLGRGHAAATAAGVPALERRAHHPGHRGPVQIDHDEAVPIRQGVEVEPLFRPAVEDAVGIAQPPVQHHHQRPRAGRGQVGRDVDDHLPSGEVGALGPGGGGEGRRKGAGQADQRPQPSDMPVHA